MRGIDRSFLSPDRFLAAPRKQDRIQGGGDGGHGLVGKQAAQRGDAIALQFLHPGIIDIHVLTPRQ